MLLARGGVRDRPFGKTIGTIARRGVTGQLTAELDGSTYAIAFERGHIVAASSPMLADSAAAIALASDIIAPDQTKAIEKWLAAVPDADELQVIATVALMPAEEVHRLRRRVIAQRAARIVALEHGDFVLTSTVALPVAPDSEFHVGGIVYQAARTCLSEQRLHAITRSLGTRFELRGDSYDELPYYGFGETEKPFLRALAGGMMLDDVIGHGRAAQAMVYALAACGALYCEAVASPSRLARGTNSPLRGRDTAPSMPTTIDQHVEHATEPLTKSTAEEAFVRAQLALRGDRVDDAIFDLELATQLAPNEPRYFAALAWARFCRAPDKAKIAGQTRAMLQRAVARSDSPILPHYYLGMVERIMNRTEQALEHFREVLELQPNHREAQTEIRFLTRKS